jgi:hypothetical protein
MVLEPGSNNLSGFRQEKLEIGAAAISMHCGSCARYLTQRIKIMNKLCHLRLYPMIRSIGVAVAIILAGCASIPAPTEQMAVSKTAVSDAISAGSNEFAPQQLKIAMEKMNAAERAMVDEDYLHAWQLAEQVQVDAQLAALLAHSAKAQKTASKLLEDNRALQQDIERNAQ